MTNDEARKKSETRNDEKRNSSQQMIGGKASHRSARVIAHFSLKKRVGAAGHAPALPRFGRLSRGVGTLARAENLRYLCGGVEACAFWSC